MKKRLILGDIHGHFAVVKEIYNKEKPDEVICLGDYVDSFTIKPEQIKQSLVNLFKLQAKHNKNSGKKTFRLLLGNHDYHYIMPGEQYTGKNRATEELCSDLIHEAIDSGDIEMAYIDEVNKTIYTHAGVSQTWYNEWLQNSLSNIHTVTLDAFRFTFGNRYDSSGDNKFSSPIWIRPYSLGCDMYKDADGVEWRQVVGHTVSKAIIDFTVEKFTEFNPHPNFIMCDALPWQYLVEYIDDDGKIDSYDIVDYKQFDDTYRQ